MLSNNLQTQSSHIDNRNITIKKNYFVVKKSTDFTDINPYLTTSSYLSNVKKLLAKG